MIGHDQRGDGAADHAERGAHTGNNRSQPAQSRADGGNGRAHHDQRGARNSDAGRDPQCRVDHGLVLLDPFRNR